MSYVIITEMLSYAFALQSPPISMSWCSFRAHREQLDVRARNHEEDALVLRDLTPFGLASSSLLSTSLKLGSRLVICIFDMPGPNELKCAAHALSFRTLR